MTLSEEQKNILRKTLELGLLLSWSLDQDGNIQLRRLVRSQLFLCESSSFDQAGHRLTSHFCCQPIAHK